MPTTPNRIKPLFGEKIIILVGDGASPTEVFTAPAMINTSRGLTFSTSTESDELIDLNNQSAPASMVRRVKSVDLKLDGAGMVHADDVKTWLDWAAAGTIKNVKIQDAGKWSITVPMVLTNFQISGDRVKSSECQITLEQADVPTIGTGV